jgi:ElaB/YqjD/DUF883 family membrane-anchored ribosome-binding protein
MQTFTDRASRAAHDTADRISDGVDRATDTAKKVADDLAEKGEQLKESQERMVKECSGWVRRNPMTALVVATGVGFVLSRLTR